MKALTISQPYASMIADGEKWIENRKWFTWYRGPLAIHAGKGTQYLSRKELQEFPHGCVIATCNVVGCVSMKDIAANMHVDNTTRNKLIEGTNKTWQEVQDHVHTEGFYCWILEDITKLNQPIECKGKQGIWNWEPAS